MLIQNEYCNCGTLSDVIAENYRRLSHLSEPELKDLLLQVAGGLKYIHSTSLVHMDIKPSEYLSLKLSVDYCQGNPVDRELIWVDMFVPGNIFISRKSVASYDECDEDDGLTTSVVYKIGKMA